MKEASLNCLRTLLFSKAEDVAVWAIDNVFVNVPDVKFVNIRKRSTMLIKMPANAHTCTVN